MTRLINEYLQNQARMGVPAETIRRAEAVLSDFEGFCEKRRIMTDKTAIQKMMDFCLERMDKLRRIGCGFEAETEMWIAVVNKARSLAAEEHSHPAPSAPEQEPKKEPHIICLAAAHHYRIRPAMTEKAWIISLVRIGNRADKFMAHGETFWETERIARAYLSGLPNVKGE